MNPRSKTKIAVLLSLVVSCVAISTMLLGNITSNLFAVFGIFFLITVVVVGIAVEFVARSATAVPSSSSVVASPKEQSVPHRQSEVSNTDLEVVLQAMQRLILAFGKDLTISEVHVNGLSQHFPSDGIAGRNFLEFAFSRSNILSDAVHNLGFQLKGVFGLGTLQWKLTSKGLLKDFSIDTDSGPVAFQIRFFPIYKSQVIEKIIVDIEDITELMGAKENANRKKSEMEKIYAMLQIPDSIFNLFMQETVSLFEGLKEDMAKLKSKRDNDGGAVIGRMFRSVHTIKANARLFRLATFETAAHNVETYLARIKDRKGATDQDLMVNLVSRLMEVNEEIYSFKTLRREVLGKNDVKNDFNNKYKVQWVRSLLQQFSLAIREATFNDREFESIKWQVDRALSSFEKTSLLEYINRYDGLIEELADRMQKKIAPIKHTIEYQYFDAFTISRINDILVHCIRNSIDHGIGTPDERKTTGKTEEGLITLETKEIFGEIIIRISDNGRGIDIDKVCEKGLSQGIITPEQAATMTADEKAELVFSPGFTTKSAVTDVSGRGVGMDVVRVMAKELGGDAKITSTSKHGTSITIRFPEKRDDFLTTYAIYDLSQVFDHAVKDVEVILRRKNISVNARKQASAHTLVMGDKLYAKDMLKNVLMEITTIAQEGSAIFCDFSAQLGQRRVDSYEFIKMDFSWTSTGNLNVDKNSPAIKEAVHAAERQNASIMIRGDNKINVSVSSGIPVRFSGYDLNICLFVSDAELVRSHIEHYFEKYLNGWTHKVFDITDPRDTIPNTPSIVFVESDFLHLYADNRPREVLKNDSIIAITNSTRGTEVLSDVGLAASNLLFTPNPLSKLAVAQLLEVIILRQFVSGFMKDKSNIKLVG
ncbi:MAG: ATP-binding protein [Oligoflexales bacterium]